MTTQHGTVQPFLHELVTCVKAPGLALSAPDGNVRGAGAQGFYLGDRRTVRSAIITVDGREPEHFHTSVTGVGAARFLSVVRGVGDDLADPTVVLERHRVVDGATITETIALRSTARVPVAVEVRLVLACDFADMATVKSGDAAPAVTAQVGEAGLRWQQGDATVEAVAADASTDAAAGAFSWRVEVPPRGSWTTAATITTTIAAPAAFDVVAATGTPPWSVPTVTADDRRLPALLDQSLQDLAALLLDDPQDPTDRYLAAGAPWFLTLFGRDSLWAARMLLPLGTDLARGTLTTLARRQGRHVDARTAEQPGKILHEVRREELNLADGLSLPPVYYGTVDATALWVCLLVDAWRWGLPAEDVEPLLPACEAALGWLLGPGDSDGDGFLEYVDLSGRGLANQGWKDSGDSIQWADGRLADAPIALCEVQGYAYEAAVGGAQLLEAFGRPGTDRWRSWAAALGERFRAQFWVEDADGAYPAVALDRDKRRVDSVASNMGHLLGTGLLSDEESELVARRLGGRDMDSGFGLRTLTARSPRFGPLSYHGGSVWPHDTAIAISGLARSGQSAVAASLIDGLLTAAPAFDYRLPELFGGEQREGNRPPLPYPAACRPQAWAAATSVAVLQTLTGLRPDVPAGTVTMAPLDRSPVGALTVSGLVVGGARADVRISSAGAVTSLALPPGLTPLGLAVSAT